MKATEINKASKKQIALEARREKSRDLMIGVEALKEKKYLKPNATEKPVQLGDRYIDPYQTRVDESRLNNMFAEAVGDAAGRAFAKPAKPSEDMPDALKAFLFDVDGQGSNFQVFGKEVAETAVAEGTDFVLVDHPQRPEGAITAEQEAALRLSPYWRRYSGAAVLDWKFALRGRESRLVWLKLKEAEDDQVQIRILFAGNPEARPEDESRWARFELWKPVEADKPDGEWALDSFGPIKPQTEIPFVEFPTDLAPPFCARPPFADLAELTIAHYRKTSNLDNIEKIACYPVKYAAGFSRDDFAPTVAGGPENFFVSPDANAKIAIAEPLCSSNDSLHKTLAEIEAQGRSMSSQPMVTEAAANLTATDALLRAASSTSRLESWVLQFEDSFARLFRFTAIFMGIVKPEDLKGWGSIVLNRQFIPLGRNVEGARLAHERNIAGKLSDETTHAVMVAAEIIPETVAFEDERERIAEEGIAPPSEADRNAPDLTGADEDEAA